MFSDPADRLRTSEAVFVGIVQDSKQVNAGGHHVVTNKTTFEVEKVWKGELLKVETLGTVEAFERGQRYLVFASVGSEAGSANPRLTTSLECEAARPASEAEPDVKWLNEHVGNPKPAANK